MSFPPSAHVAGYIESMAPFAGQTSAFATIDPFEISWIGEERWACYSARPAEL